MRGRTPDLDEQLDRVEGLCPFFLAKPLRFLRKPRVRLLRLTVGVLCIIGGLLSFLPVLGIELLPIGLMLIAIDVPFLRRPVALMIDWLFRAGTVVISARYAIAARLHSRSEPMPRHVKDQSRAGATAPHP